MDNQPLLRFLQSGDIINVSTAQEIAGFFKEKEIPKNEFFLREGKTSNDYLILTRGFLRSYVIDTEGNEITTAFHSPVSPVFEVASFFQRMPSVENIEALTDSEGFVISFEELNRLFHSYAGFREFGRMILVKGFSSYKMRTLSMITQTAEQRYSQLLSSNPEILQQAPLKYIASYLGVTDTSLSRIRKSVSDQS